MSLILYPRAAAGDTLRVWVGAFKWSTAPALQWSLNGKPASPTAIRAIESARSDKMLPVGTSPGATPRAFTGLYEFRNVAHDTLYDVRVTAGGEEASLTTKTLPKQVSADINRPFRILLISCYHAAEDRRNEAGLRVAAIKRDFRPDMTLLLGDQVYLDLPTFQDFEDDLPWLGAEFEKKYLANWSGPAGYSHVLSSAPAAHVPDDHEFWNNYPHWSPAIGNSWDKDGRDRWTEAAKAMYRAFQAPNPSTNPADAGRPYIIDVPPLSFFIADLRSERDYNRGYVMTPTARAELKAWTDRVAKSGLYGVFVSGQSMFQERTGKLEGKMVDYELPDYLDFSSIVTQLGRIPRVGRRPLLFITGDVHWGRIVAAKDLHGGGRRAMYEVISSPSSLVTGPKEAAFDATGLTFLRDSGNFFKKLFGGEADPWPRHSDASNPPTFFASETFAGRFTCEALHRQKGNHVAMLSFNRFGSGLQMTAQYFPLHSDRAVGAPTKLEPINLTSL